MKIALYFGSFNPIHIGHVALAKYVKAHAGVDAVWLVVSPQNPLKKKSGLWDDRYRLELAQLACEDCEGIEVSNIEFDLPQPNYTANTLRQFSKRYPEHTFELMIGADNCEIFDKWREYDFILSHYTVLVYPREGYNSTKLMSGMKIIDAPLYPYSSTQVRQALEEGQSIEDLVPQKVYQRILEKN